MTQIIQNLAEISADYDAVLCDLWGCLHNGARAFPAAVAALQAFRAGGGRVILLTNAPRPKVDVVAHLAHMGVPDDCYDDIVTSGQAAQFAMLSGAVGSNVYHIGADKDEGFFSAFDSTLADLAAGAGIIRVPITQATGIVCTGLADDTTETPADYRATLLMGKTLGLPMLCANPDITVHVAGKLLYCAGALAAEYEAMGGATLYFGKPHPPIYDLARRQLAALGCDDPRILCIGDGIATDIAGAMGEGMDSLYITSGVDAARFGANPAAPDPAALQAFLAEKQANARFAMGFLG
ncbi:MAG: TIGR01459 family HAD-type hydrolase [Cypionkella sp.]|nr:TIGR01459 family HAD-type hydrolase [Cypionkella sp.]